MGSELGMLLDSSEVVSRSRRRISPRIVGLGIMFGGVIGMGTAISLDCHAYMGIFESVRTLVEQRNPYLGQIPALNPDFIRYGCSGLQLIEPARIPVLVAQSLGAYYGTSPDFIKGAIRLGQSIASSYASGELISDAGLLLAEAQKHPAFVASSRFASRLGNIVL